MNSEVVPANSARGVIDNLAAASRLIADMTTQAAGSLDESTVATSGGLSVAEMGRRAQLVLAALRGETPAVGSEASPSAAPVLSLEQRHAAFISKYRIRAIPDQDSQVAVTIPKGTTYAAFLTEAQELSIELHKANSDKYRADQAVYPSRLQAFLDDAAFTKKATGIEVVTDGCVSESHGKTRKGQETFLAENKLTMEQIAELAVAHTARYLLDGQSIFQGQTVRAVGGALGFDDLGGLYADDINDVDSGDGVSSSIVRLRSFGW